VSVCVSVTTVSPTKTDGPIEVPFGCKVGWAQELCFHSYIYMCRFHDIPSSLVKFNLYSREAQFSSRPITFQVYFCHFLCCSTLSRRIFIFNLSRLVLSNQLMSVEGYINKSHRRPYYQRRDAKAAHPFSNSFFPTSAAQLFVLRSFMDSDKKNSNIRLFLPAFVFPLMTIVRVPASASLHQVQ